MSWAVFLVENHFDWLQPDSPHVYSEKHLATFGTQEEAIKFAKEVSRNMGCSAVARELT